MPRTTQQAVQDVLTAGGDYDTVAQPSLLPYIQAVTVMVDRVATCAAERRKPLTPGELELIERWAAAHAYCCSDQTYASKSTGGASGAFQGKTMMAFEGTKYGQMALNIDYSGCLTVITKRQVAGGFWLGSHRHEHGGER